MQASEGYTFKFWNHSKQHSSKTYTTLTPLVSEFWNHSKQHSSKTLPMHVI
ncbi:hypothetical protein HMPREF9189_1866 [Streptococcus sp. oral taxon 071 str. 73H25AP]|nr:hypothetical protein HMPREF9189_1866 [Streptococcus sp. oral taxon 071 str. 73H25AP]